MSYLETRKKYLFASGNTVKEQLRQSTIDNVSSDFNDHPAHVVATIQNGNVDVRIAREKKANPYTSFQRDLITIMTTPEVKLDMGEIIDIKGRSFILYDENELDIFPTYYGLKVNNSVHIEFGEKRIQSGTDSTGRPIYKTEPMIETLRCFATVNARNNVFTEFGDKINTPQDRLIAIVQFNPDRKLEDGLKCMYQNSNHHIIGVDETNVSNGIGYVVLLLDKIQEKSKS
ncbi:hypothetical protein [Bacillus sp. Marseille-P3800]|uniref:hypothetical protein n=1 Tax=Bacillus sp. Marseille-P3800 TaxID=2014782 RepID=UPI000C08A87F|nr:hypothetical protein [Bacillus sp. Marseille-P3800]